MKLAINILIVAGVLFLAAVGYWVHHNWNDIAGIACLNGSHEGCLEYKPRVPTSLQQRVSDA